MRPVYLLMNPLTESALLLSTTRWRHCAGERLGYSKLILSQGCEPFLPVSVTRAAKPPHSELQ